MARGGAALLTLLLAIGTCAWAADQAADAADTAIQAFDAQIDAGRYAEVSSPLEAYVKTHPSSWRALYQLGYVDFRLHKLQASVTMLSRSLVLNGQFADAHKILAYDLNIMGRQDLAMPELRKAIQLDPNSAESHYELGRILFEQGSYSEAVEQFRTTEALEPQFVKAYHNLGLAYAALGEKTKAVAEFKTALALNTKARQPSAWPLIDFGTYYNMQDDFVHAKEMLQRAIAVDSRWDQAYSELAKAYRGLGQTDQAIDSYDRAIAINPNKLEYHYALAALYRKAGRPAAATEELKTYARLKDAGGPK